MAYTLKQSGRYGPLKSLVTAVTTASSGNTHLAYQLNKAYSAFSLTAVIGTTKKNVVILEGSVNGSSWGPVAGSTWSSTQGTKSIKYVTGKPLPYVRAAWITKSTAGTSGGINAWITASF